MQIKQLVKLQQTFQASVLDPDKADPGAWISAGGRAAPASQLAVYAHAYPARLKEVLAHDYPVMLLAMGEDPFNMLADGYIQAHLSHYFSLRDFGSHLPCFVSDLLRHGRYQDMPWLGELAIFEWTLGQAFDAADAPSLTEQALAAIPAQAWSELRFSVHPAVHRLELEWNIPAMWLALSGDKPTPFSAMHDIASPWLIWREHLVTRFRSIPADEQQALDSLCAGENFKAVCEALASTMGEDEVPLRAASLLKVWIVQGLISGIE